MKTSRRFDEKVKLFLLPSANALSIGLGEALFLI